jgi:type II restriction/modification system DNA methylase subunit YeeA
MTPQDFIRKWRESRLPERSAAQAHFIDFCALLGERTPADLDANREWYAFEKGAMKIGGGDGWADVWKRGCFAWEYKSKGANLGEALKQLKLYAGSLENPPLLIVSDMERIELHTNWTNMVQETHRFALDDLLDGAKRSLLKKAFSPQEVEVFKPGRARADLTKDVAKEFVKLAQSLRDRGHAAEAVAHFVNRLVFCMFAEDVDLLPKQLFKKMLESSLGDPDSFVRNCRDLFRAMAERNGRVGYDSIHWFNGGLFDSDEALALTPDDIRLALRAAGQDWSNIDPSIMGTLFERGLDPGKRSQLGAHYTDPEKIMLIVDPVIVEPLTAEWDAAKARIAALMERARTHPAKGERTKAENEAARLKTEFLEKLKNFRVLDPACGSGNFLYLSLKALKDIELRVNVESEQMGLPRSFPAVGPENLFGIEINPFAAELARVSVWIGEIQWMREHGFDASRNPILKPLNTIECRDALLNADGTEAEWPPADVIVGNPPFLGDKLMIGVMGAEYVTQLRKTYQNKLAGGADLVCYWFAKASQGINRGIWLRCGLVATNSIRGGANRAVLDDIVGHGRIFEAWSDEPWVLDGAAVRVSIVCFDEGTETEACFNGRMVGEIFADLTSGVDLTEGRQLTENKAISFIGDQKSGPFDISAEVARSWLRLPSNPNGKMNRTVVRPWSNGVDVTRRSSDTWIVDFGTEMSEADAAIYEAPFEHIRKYVAPMRLAVRRDGHRRYWWRHGESRPGMRRALSSLSRYLATPRVAKHRLFVWLSSNILPDCQLVIVARDDDTTFGILHSRMHEHWSLRLGTSLEDRPRYTPSTTFETFPFPEGLTPNIPAVDYTSDPRAQAIAIAAARLNELRENWLNPPDLIKRVPEVVPGYPDRILPVDDAAAVILKKRTLTNLYNERPAWLDNAHRDLDAAVAAAYGWTDWGKGLSDEEILERLFKLNQERAATGR